MRLSPKLELRPEPLTPAQPRGGGRILRSGQQGVCLLGGVVPFGFGFRGRGHLLDYLRSWGATIAYSKASIKALDDDIEVAAFPGQRLRHFQKQGSVEEELQRSGRRVQVELKLKGAP